MKLKPVIAALLLTAAAGVADCRAEELVLTRSQCVEIALQDNPTVKIADLEVRKSDYGKKEVLAGLFPSIDFSGSYQRTIELQTIRMNMGGESQNLKMGSDNSWNLGFSAQLPLIAPTLWKSIQLSDTQILANLESSRASKIDLVNSVNQAYYALMLALASRKVVSENYDVAKANAAVFQRQFQTGTASEYDVLRSSVQVKNIEPELLQADISVKQCRLQLKVLMGVDAESEITPAEDLEHYQDMMGTYAGAVNPDLTDNTSMRSLVLQTKMADQNVALKKLAWVPTLSAQFNLSWMALSNGSPFKNQEFNPYSNVGFSLSVPIFSGGKKYYGLKQAQVDRQELALQRENLERSLKMQVDLAIDNINRQARQITTSAEGVRQAAKAKEIMQKSFEIGAATYLELRDSELADTSARLSYLQAIHNYLVSTSELDALLGKGVD